MKGNYKHGCCGTPLYRSWYHMKSRCSNPNDKNYDIYGGRGITVCDEWRNSFETFRDWAFANGYADNLTIDRIDNDKGYSPENCRWISIAEQQRNKSNCIYIEAFGEKHTIAEWSRIKNIPAPTLYSRVQKGIAGEELFQSTFKRGEKV